MIRLELVRLEFLSPTSANDNVDVLIELTDGQTYSLLVATPDNLSWCMDNEGLGYFFSYPAALLVKVLDKPHVSAAVEALLAANRETFLCYCVHQSRD